MNLKKYTNEKLSTLILFALDVILRRPNLKDGFLPTSNAQIEKDGDFVNEPDCLGFVEKEVLNKEGNYSFCRPEGQQQNIGSDKMHCVSESACNTIETNINYLLFLMDNGKATKKHIEIINIFKSFGLIKNIDGEETCRLSTRYVAAGSGTTIRGNGQKAVADFIRHYGLIPYDEHPYAYDWNEYYYTGDYIINGNRLPSTSIKKGQKLTEYIEFNYEWVYPINIIETLIYGAIQTVGYCWTIIKDGIFVRNGGQANHAFQTDAFINNIFSSFDSYNPFAKKLARDFFKSNGMLFTVKLKKPLTEFNADYIQMLKRRGLEYILLVNKYENYDPGVYRLLDDKIEKAELKIILDNGVQKLADAKKLTGISADDFANLLNKF